MSDKVIPTVQLGGRLWPLKVSHKVLQSFSALARCNMANMESALMRYDMQTMMLWVIMSMTDPTLKRGQVDEWLDELPVTEAIMLVTENVTNAMKAAFPNPEEKAEDADPDAEDAAADPTEPRQPAT